MNQLGLQIGKVTAIEKGRVTGQTPNADEEVVPGGAVTCAGRNAHGRLPARRPQRRGFGGSRGGAAEQPKKKTWRFDPS